MKEITAYACDFCKKYSKSKSTIKSHERICFHNPVTKSCATCIFYTQEEHETKETGVYQYRPICAKGVRLFTETDKLKVTLNNNCAIWEKMQ